MLGSVRIMMFNATFNNISGISWQSVLLVEETGENCKLYHIMLYISSSAMFEDILARLPLYYLAFVHLGLLDPSLISSSFFFFFFTKRHYFLKTCRTKFSLFKPFLSCSAAITTQYYRFLKLNVNGMCIML